MQYRRLGRAGVHVSTIALGSWLTYGSSVAEEAAIQCIHKAYELGINFFDTANAYNRGAAEQVVGRALQDYSRDSFVLATKVYFPMGEGPNDRGLSRKHVMEQCHASLRRLRTDYVDLYQCHRFDPEAPLEETVRAMDDLIRQGKVIYWGFSEWPAEQIENCLKVCGDRYYRPKGSQPQYSLIHRTIEKDVMPRCAQAGIGQVVWSPLVRDRQLLEKVQRLVPLAQERDCTLAQLALAWVLSHPEITSCIVGATRPHQIEENAEASGITLDNETARRMEEILSE